MVIARKRFGQHFLEPPWVEKVIRAIDPKADETFIEIGPGRGALTRPLAERAKSVIAYEIDRDLVAELQSTMPSNVAIVEADFLEEMLGFPQISDARVAEARCVRVAGNLPYNVASPIMFKLVELHRASVAAAGTAMFTDAMLMLQREVADRVTAQPGSKEYGALSILIGHRATATRVLTLPPGAFRPPPKVYSAVVRLVFHGPQPPVRDEKVFAEVVGAAFTRRRKTMVNALAAYRSQTQVGPNSDSGQTLAGLDSDCTQTEVRLSPEQALAIAGVERWRRPETLTIEEFARLADAYTADPR